jgi:parvulin-like peptidyl-prolyl isomerase
MENAMFAGRPRHPAIHIAALGILVAAAILVVKGPTTADAAKRVVVTGSDLVQLRAGFMRTWQREPTAAELRGLLERHIRQEVLYREALARGYDRDDPVVRRAMQQKMEFLAAAQRAEGPPSDQEIEAYFALRREKYRLQAVLSLDQVYVRDEATEPPAEARASVLLDRLRREDPGADELDAWGDAIMLPPVLTDASEQTLRSTFGADFADAVLELAPGSWQGPVRSGFGLHLVKVVDRQASRVPDWTEVRAIVVQDMEYEATNASKEQLYQEIAQSYQVVTDAEVAALLESTAG